MVKVYWLFFVAALGVTVGFCLAAAFAAGVIWRKNRRIKFLNRRVKYLKESGPDKVPGQARDA